MIGSELLNLTSASSILAKLIIKKKIDVKLHELISIELITI